VLQNTGDDQQLTFYSEGDCASRFFDGHNYTAICEVISCTSLEQVHGQGAKTLPPGTMPSADDDAYCEPNPEQFARWARAEAAKYTVFYIVLSCGSLMYWLVVAGHVYRRRDNYSRMSTRTKLWLAFIAFRFWTASVDLVSDWGCYDSSLSTIRFVHLAERDGYDPAAIADGALASCVVSTLLYIVDIYRTPAQWYIKSQPNTPQAAATTSTILGMKPAVYLLESLFGSSSPEQLRKRLSRIIWWSTLAAVVVEDGPQLVLTLLYSNIVGFDVGDEVAMLSLVLSSIGLAINLGIVLGCCCPNLAAAKTSTQDENCRSWGTGTLVDNPMFQVCLPPSCATPRFSD